MTVEELLEELEQMDPHLIVWVSNGPHDARLTRSVEVLTEGGGDEEGDFPLSVCVITTTEAPETWSRAQEGGT